LNEFEEFDPTYVLEKLNGSQKTKMARALLNGGIQFGDWNLSANDLGVTIESCSTLIQMRADGKINMFPMVTIDGGKLKHLSDMKEKADLESGGFFHDQN